MYLFIDLRYGLTHTFLPQYVFFVHVDIYFKDPPPSYCIVGKW